MEKQTELHVQKEVIHIHTEEKSQAFGSKLQIKVTTTSNDARQTTHASNAYAQKKQNEKVTVLLENSEQVGQMKQALASQVVKSVQSSTQGKNSHGLNAVYRPNSARGSLTRAKTGGPGGLKVRYPPSRSVRSIFVPPSLPEHEDQVTTQTWLRLYSLCGLNLDLAKLLEDCQHVDDTSWTVQTNKPLKYCNVFPSILVKGRLKHVHMSLTEMDNYDKQLDLVLRRYLKRLIWLLSGSRRVFGTMVVESCVILIDTSGSMAPYLESLKKELVSLIWEQFYTNGNSFNLMCFSNKYEMWSDQVQPATLENCHSAMEWVFKLKTSGSTKTLEALKLAFGHPGLDSIYLLTDGKPDVEKAELLRQVLADNKQHIPVNTTSFNCEDMDANSFLEALASKTGGRYHRYLKDFDAEGFARRVIDEGMTDPTYPYLPTFESDDLQKLGQEIFVARQYLQQMKHLRTLYGNGGGEQSIDGSRPRRASLPNRQKQVQRPGTAKSGRGKTPWKYNFFKDAYWVPGVWNTFWKYAPPKHVTAGMLDPMLPEKEEQITTEKWLTMYMVSLYNLDLSELVPRDQASQKSNSGFSDIYAKFRVGGSLKYLRLLPQELIYYEILIEKFYKRYLKRLYWLLTSSRLVFGTVIHKNCVIVVDTSGSMRPSMEIMQKALVDLIWEQVFSQECRFTLIEFSAHASFWKDSLQPSTKENCAAAVAWVSTLKAENGTNTLEAIQCSLRVPELDSVYFLSDGEPNQPPEEILEVVEKQFKNSVPVNSISFNCNSDKANHFLESLATQTGGRYHRYRSDSKAIQLAPKLVNTELTDTDLALLSQLEGSDLHRLVEEIKCSKKTLNQIRQYRALSKKKEIERPYDWAGSSYFAKTQVHKFFVQRPATYGKLASRPKSAME